MTQYDYHKPEFRIYGTVSLLTQAVANSMDAMEDNGNGNGSMDKTS
jgi:hypothetical protein